MHEPYYSALQTTPDPEEQVYSKGLDQLDDLENGYVVLLERKEVSGKIHSIPLPWFIRCCVLWWRRCCYKS